MDRDRSPGASRQPGATCPHGTGAVYEWRNVLDLLGELRRRVRVRDVLLLLAVPAALLGLHTLPLETRRGLGFYLREPTVLTAYASHFVHVDDAHLAGNLVAYLLVVSPAYALSVLSERERHFRLVFLVVLAGSPLVVSLAHLPYRSNVVALGFSGVAMALYGYASLVYAGHLSTRLAGDAHLDQAPLVFFSQVAVVAVVVAPPTAVSLVVAGVALLVTAGYTASFLRSLPPETSALALRPAASYVVTGILTGTVVGFFLAVGFAAQHRPGRIVNQFAHFVGFASGFLLSYLVLRVDASLSHVRHCAGPESDCPLHDSPFTRLLRRLLLSRGSDRPGDPGE